VKGEQRESTDRRAGAGRPRAAARLAAARIRAAQATERLVRTAARVLVRLYPTLKDLVARRWIVEDGPAEVGATPPLSGRRGKIVYKLTADGKEHFQELLSDSGPAAWEDENFGVHFAFFGRTQPDTRLRILEGRRTRLEERRVGLRAALARTRERLDSYTLELQRHGLESVEREVRWLNELIDSERTSPSEPPTPR
jgi:DNA-binding PadR family transcriptional regulator